MDRMNRVFRAVYPYLIAAAMAGCAIYTAALAIGLEVHWIAAYLPALAAALTAWVGGRGAGWRIAAVFGAIALIAVPWIGRTNQIVQWVAGAVQTGAQEVPADVAAAMCVSASALLSAVFAMLLPQGVGAPLTVFIEAAALILSLAAGDNVPLWVALPGMISGAAAFALPRDGRDGARAAVPVAAAVIAVIALLIAPTTQPTWEPLETLAARMRDVMADYTHFTEERYEFTINEKGYNYGARVADRAVVRLGDGGNMQCKVVTADGTYGYVYRGYLRVYGAFSRNRIGYNTADAALYLRDGEHLSRVATLPAGQFVYLLKLNGNWAYVRLMNGRTCYMQLNTLAKLP